VNPYEIKAGIGIIAGKTVCSMLERLECEVPRYYKKNAKYAYLYDVTV